VHRSKPHRPRCLRTPGARCSLDTSRRDHGTGFSGLLAAIRLQKTRCNDFVMLERSSELGGPGRSTHIPRRGGRSDQPLLHLVHTLSVQEIICSAKRIARIHEPCHRQVRLAKHARTNQAVTRLAFDEREFLWHVETESGERYTARFVIDTSGVLANPHTPRIKGAETFKGPMFHSALGSLRGLRGKRVGVIGSGCSAAQIVRPSPARYPG